MKPSLSWTWWRRAASVMLVTSVSACSVALKQLGPKEYDDARLHSIFVDADGHPLRPSTTQRAVTLGDDDHGDSVYGAWIHGILDGLRASGRHDVLLRIHGGMMPLDQTATDTDITRHIMNDTPFYPIYVNWESSIQSTYLDHLLYIRQGEAYRGWDPRGVWLSPLYLAADAGRAISHAPVAWTVQARNLLADAHSVNGVATGPAKRAQVALFGAKATSTAQLCAPNAAPLTTSIGPTVEYGSDCRSRWTRLTEFGIGIATTIGVLPYDRNMGRYRHNSFGRFSIKLPTHLGWPALKLFSPWASRHIAWLPLRPITSLLIDMAGPPAYENMRRRTTTMFGLAQEAEPDSISATLRYRPASGAVAQLMDSLQAFVASMSADPTHPERCGWSAASPSIKRANDAPYQVSIVAHSLGAVIASDIVRGCAGIPFRNIVFMASAATEDQVEHEILPYLHADTSARFFNLTLNPAADRDEWPNGNWASTQGSLLAWLDGFINTPQTDVDRVFGKYENTITSIHVMPDDVRSRVYIKSFPYHGPYSNGGLPFRHADFVHEPYWRCDFWMPVQPAAECASLVGTHETVPQAKR